MQVVQSFFHQDDGAATKVDIPEHLRREIIALLKQIYPAYDASVLCERVAKAFWQADTTPQKVRRKPEETDWSEKDTYVITYGNSFVDGEHKPLDLLYDFFKRYLKDTVSGIHILPYFPFTSDDGFAITDYRAVNSQLGAWEDIVRISDEFRLMSDLVINHCSSQSVYFNEYLQGHAPFDKFFYEADPSDDLSQVVRPRAHDLLRKVETANGTKHVWCTFSHDQVDFNFENPEVLLEFLRILRFHMDQGVRTLRLDAVAFLWKEIGSSSIHLPQTHSVIKLIRLLSDYDEKALTLITETNVPNAENLSYFGSQDEAHAVYNFSLPPLVLHALHNGTAKYLNLWQSSLPPIADGCTFFNFTASHDGIGMRPAEGFLSDDQIDTLIDTVRSFGGLVSMRRISETLVRPYEINTSLFDALKGTTAGEDQWNIERFLCSQIIAMGMQGIPGFYIHSLLATHNDREGVDRLGHNRAINRHPWNYQTLRSLLEDGGNSHAKVFVEMKRLINIRTKQMAFHPNAGQTALVLDDGLFGFARNIHGENQQVYAIHNLTAEPKTLEAQTLVMDAASNWVDLLSASEAVETLGQIEFKPYQCRWISNANFGAS